MQSKSIIAGNRHRLFGLREPFSCFLCLTLLKFFDTLRRNQRLMENGTFPLRIDAEMEQVFRSRSQRCDTGSRHGSRGDANVANDCVIVMLHCCLVSLRLTDCSQLLSIVRAYGVFVGFDRFFSFFDVRRFSIMSALAVYWLTVVLAREAYGFRNRLGV